MSTPLTLLFIAPLFMLAAGALLVIDSRLSDPRRDGSLQQIKRQIDLEYIQKKIKNHLYPQIHLN